MLATMVDGVLLLLLLVVVVLVVLLVLLIVVVVLVVVDGGSALGCPKKTLFLNFASFFESLVRMGVQRPQKKFQRYRPINDT